MATKTTTKTTSKTPSTKAAAAKTKSPKVATSKSTSTKKPGSASVAKKRSRESAISGPFHFEPYKLKKNEAYMNKDQLAHFLALLTSWDNELREGADRTVHHMKDEAAIFPDPLDRAAQEEEFTLELRTRDRERKLIKKIEESLELIDTGEYGFCESCGAEIGIRRLEARPTATLCIDCKTIDEIREKQEIG
jgi:DnaK suppressor protein